MEIKGAAECIQQFREFFEMVCMLDIVTVLTTGQLHLMIDFSALSSFDPALAEQLLEAPEDTITAANLALKADNDWWRNIQQTEHEVQVRFIKLPKDTHFLISEIRSEHVGRLLQVEGEILKTSKVLPHTISTRYECPQCGQVITILQKSEKLEEPTRCGCGRRGKFRLLAQENTDSQFIEICEPMEKIERVAQPKTIDIELRGSLCEKDITKYSNAGSRIIVTGIVTVHRTNLKSGGQSTRQELQLSVHSIFHIDKELEVALTTKDIEEIQRIIPEDVIASFCPEIKGYEKVIPKAKECLLYAACGGAPIYNDDGSMKRRGMIHMLLIGDPGSAKTQLLESTLRLLPGARFSSGKGNSGVGLTASVGKDEKYGYFLQPGLVVLCHGSMVGIDEFSTIPQEDQDHLRTVMESGAIHINKANIHTPKHGLRAETTIIAASNPQYGKFDTSEKNIALQFGIDFAILDRFNIIWAFNDSDLTEQDDDIIADAVLDLHTRKKLETKVAEETIKKYIAYVRKNYHPRFNEEQRDILKSWFKELRVLGRSNKVISITTRSLNTAIKLSEAIARFHKSHTVERTHVERARDLVLLSLMGTGVIKDAETGKLLPDMMYINSPSTKKDFNRITLVRDIYEELVRSIGKAQVDMYEIHTQWKERCTVNNTTPKDYEFEEIIEKLKRSGEFFEPRHGIIQRL